MPTYRIGGSYDDERQYPFVSGSYAVVRLRLSQQLFRLHLPSDFRISISRVFTDPMVGSGIQVTNKQGRASL